MRIYLICDSFLNFLIVYLYLIDKAPGTKYLELLRYLQIHTYLSTTVSIRGKDFIT